MLIQYTDEEQKQIQHIKNKYVPEWQIIVEERKDEEDEVIRKTLLVKSQTILEQMETELNAFNDKCQRERFAPIAAEGARAILEHAKEQAPAILDNLYEMHAAGFGEYRDPEKLWGKVIKETGMGTYKDGRLYLNTNYAMSELKSELRLHIAALQEDRQALNELLEMLVEVVEYSDLTDNAEITEQRHPIDVTRFRRNALADIKTYGLMNDKASAHLILEDGELFKQQADGQLVLRWAVDQTPANKKAVPVYMALTYEGEDFKVTKKLSDYDKRVCEAVATRFYYWRIEHPQKPLYITPQEIWRTMNGKSSRDGKAKPSATQINKICHSMDKMRFTRFYMDISAEIEAFHLSIHDERITGGHIETYVINSSKVEFITDKGNTVQGYRISEEPILYTYNKAKNHILYVPYEMLDTSSHVQDGENVTEFKFYLLQQIQLMKNATEKGGKRFKRSNVILLEAIYKNTGVLPPEERVAGNYANETTRKQLIRRYRKTDRQKIEGLLAAWKAQGRIKGYTVLNSKNEPLKEKQQAKGYSISV